MPFELDDPVYFAYGGPDDVGRIIEVNPHSVTPYQVRWRNGDPDDWFMEQHLLPAVKASR